MKRLLWAGAVALMLHGALLLMKFNSHRQQPPRPLPRGIYLTLTAMPQETPRVTEKSKAPPVTRKTKPTVKPAPRPKSQAKHVVRPPKKEEHPVAAAATAATDQEPMMANDAQPIQQQSMEEPQPEAFLPAPLPAAGQQSANGPEQTTMEATPLYRQNPPPGYPALARRRGQEGTVQLDVLVNRRGGVNEVRLAESSGHALLDRAAMAAVQTWLFQPGKRGEENIDMWVRVPIRFALQD